MDFKIAQRSYQFGRPKAAISKKGGKSKKRGLTKERGRGNLAKLSGRTGVCQAEKVENEKKSKKALDKRGKTW